MSPRCCSVAISDSDAQDLRDSVSYRTCTHHVPAQVTPQGGSSCGFVQPHSDHLSWELKTLTDGENPLHATWNPPSRARSRTQLSCPSSAPQRGQPQPFPSPPPSLAAPRRPALLPGQGVPCCLHRLFASGNQALGRLPPPPAQTSTERAGKAGVEM